MPARIDCGRLSGGIENSTQPAADAGSSAVTKISRCYTPRVSGSGCPCPLPGSEMVPRVRSPALRFAACNDNMLHHTALDGST